jgi:8-oxo-dGTP pyrophosphatase MutT (NUDIX family)
MIRMPTTLDVIRQAAAIPLKDGLLCVVTSRSGKRLVIPKGCLEPGKTAGEIALQEAWEEAGLTGVLDTEPVGSYLYTKMGFSYHVTVFVMHVTDVADEWPEQEMRERRWLTRSQVQTQIEDAGLRKLIRSAFTSQVGARKAASGKDG